AHIPLIVTNRFKNVTRLRENDPQTVLRNPSLAVLLNIIHSRSIPTLRQAACAWHRDTLEPARHQRGQQHGSGLQRHDPPPSRKDPEPLLPPHLARAVDERRVRRHTVLRAAPLAHHDRLPDAGLERELGLARRGSAPLQRQARVHDGDGRLQRDEHEAQADEERGFPERREAARRGRALDVALGEDDEGREGAADDLGEDEARCEVQLERVGVFGCGEERLEGGPGGERPR
ncbi:unnamed protein product, partial [Mycena citricolor]